MDHQHGIIVGIRLSASVGFYWRGVSGGIIVFISFSWYYRRASASYHRRFVSGGIIVFISSSWYYRRASGWYRRLVSVSRVHRRALGWYHGAHQLGIIGVRQRGIIGFISLVSVIGVVVSVTPLGSTAAAGSGCHLQPQFGTV